MSDEEEERSRRSLRGARPGCGLKAGLRAEVVVVRTAVVEASAKLGL